MTDRLYKFVNENDIRISPKYFKIDGKIVTNPSVELQKEKGYDKVFIDSPYLETDEGYYRDFKFEIQDDTIIKVWSEPIPYDEEKTSLFNSLEVQSDE